MYEHRLPGIQSCSGTIKKKIVISQFHCGRVVSLIKIVLLRVEHLLVIIVTKHFKNVKIWGVQFFWSF